MATRKRKTKPRRARRTRKQLMRVNTGEEIVKLEVQLPRWIGNAAPRRGEPGKTRTIRATDEEWARWAVLASRAGKSRAAWLRGLAEDAAPIKPAA